jgi:S-adenosyl methyltransferase
MTTTTPAAHDTAHGRRRATMIRQSTDATGPAPGYADINVDLDRPSVARVEDYLLGGAYNVAADRALAKRVLVAVPDAARMVREHRAFLARAVRFCLTAGVRQFLDLGSAMPSVGNAHQVARHAAADVRVVLVDSDPVAVALGAALLAGDDRTAVLHADLRRPDDVLDHPDLRAVLDLDRPVAVLLVGALHRVSNEDEPHAIVARLRDRIISGSHLIVSHPCSDGGRPDAMAAIADVARHASTPLVIRSRADIERLFTNLEPVDPGLVWIPQWRPDSPDEVDDWAPRSSILAGVGRRP